MKCTIPCQETGNPCGNRDVQLVCSWTHELLSTLENDPATGMDAAIKHCSKTHYDALNMDEMLKPYVGRPEAFYQFLHDTWNWIVTVAPDRKHIFADENKKDCVCPLVRTGAVTTPNLCNCSEGFAERMFSKVLDQPVKAKVIQSVLRGGQHCVYEITLE